MKLAVNCHEPNSFKSLAAVEADLSVADMHMCREQSLDGHDDS